MLALHTDPDVGSRYWLERTKQLGVRHIGEVRTVGDLHRLGTMSPEDLRERTLWDYIPRAYHDQPGRLVLGQTGGTTGVPVWTAYLEDEFEAAFVRPFVVAAEHVGFPHGGSWLYVGPSGPHIIGKAASAIARAVGSAEPFTVDFDPRWARKMTSGSVAASRYLRHVVDQAMAVIESQAVDVLFATPPVLSALADRMTDEQRSRIKGVHYGGMAVREETLGQLQCEDFPEAVHLSGYGNTLLGCCLELNSKPGRTLDYFPYGDRLLLRTVDEEGGDAPFGRVIACRFDRACLVINLIERDHAHAVCPPKDAPPGFRGMGLRGPHTPATVTNEPAVVGLY